MRRSISGPHEYEVDTLLNDIPRLVKAVNVTLKVMTLLLFSGYCPVIYDLNMLNNTLAGT